MKSKCFATEQTMKRLYFRMELGLALGIHQPINSCSLFAYKNYETQKKKQKN